MRARTARERKAGKPRGGGIGKAGWFDFKVSYNSWRIMLEISTRSSLLKQCACDGRIIEDKCMWENANLSFWGRVSKCPCKTETVVKGNIETFVPLNSKGKEALIRSIAAGRWSFTSRCELKQRSADSLQWLLAAGGGFWMRQQQASLDRLLYGLAALCLIHGSVIRSHLAS